MIDLSTFSMQLTQRNPLVSADDTVVVEAASVDCHAGVATGKVDYIVRHGLGSQVNRLASYHNARAREGAGVIGCAIGIGVDDVDIVSAGAQNESSGVVSGIA